MKVISVNAGLPREVKWKGKTVTTGIFKAPLRGWVNVRTLNLEGRRSGGLVSSRWSFEGCLRLSI